MIWEEKEEASVGHGYIESLTPNNQVTVHKTFVNISMQKSGFIAKFTLFVCFNSVKNLGNTLF